MEAASFDKNLYVSMLCAQTGVPFKLIEMQAFEPCTTKLEINKKYFEEVLPRIKDNVKVELPETLRKAIADAKASGMIGRDVIATAKRKMDQARSTLVDHYRYLDNYAATFARCTEEYYEQIKFDGSEVIENSLFEIINRGQWVFKTANSVRGILEFETAEEIQMRYLDPAAQIDKSLNMGKYQAVWDLKHKTIRVKGGKLRANGYRHPHISSDDNVCWGNLKETYVDAVASGNMTRLFEGLHLLLSSYNPGSPYVNFAEFEKQVPVDPSKLAALHKSVQAFGGRVEALRSDMTYIGMAAMSIRQDSTEYIDELFTFSCEVGEGEDEEPTWEVTVPVYRLGPSSRQYILVGFVGQTYCEVHGYGYSERWQLNSGIGETVGGYFLHVDTREAEFNMCMIEDASGNAL